jgi:hypothetical protein
LNQKNIQSKPSKTSQSYKKDAFSNKISNNHSRNASKERKIESPNINKQRKSSKNKLDVKENIGKNAKENPLKITFNANNENDKKSKHFINNYKESYDFTNKNSARKKTMIEKTTSNLVRNESAKNLNSDIYKKTLNNNKNYLNTDICESNLIFDDNNFQFFDKSNSKSKFLSHRKLKENSVNSKFDSSFSKNRRVNSESRKYPETTGRLESKGKIRNDSSVREKNYSFQRNQESPKTQAKQKKASDLYLAENKKMLIKMPTLKFGRFYS